ncbi:bactofilin family protein [Plastoroseomonas hellenica]|uniref:Polymer-forming cytoskeletal protein n=1 Tax=Plastoroseomonas hellenica TaxID=2687306 RepID=A0ABS5EXU3_9PROT|nr:polymer-forming cytoskeletal protein [Plastoroseomonas hellenica]MBR0643131.1 polymer-forming cytoskeletal protein [Plastoroseomonas hellenica]MBR0665101.1 polymer-forming cytoskeletal protein [Plastoroseomonas hellenica]
MSIFRSRRDDTPGTGGNEPAPTTVPAARDPDLAVPPFRPAAVPTANAPVASLRPASPAMPPARPGVPGAPTAPAARVPGGMEASERRTLVVGKGISLQGTVSDAERLVVEGTVESQMIQAQQLFVSHAGVFKGEVQVEEAEIAGTFDGTITANGSLVIRATGKVLGVARTKRLSVEEGGQLSGRMEMLGENASRPSYPAGAPRPVDVAEG